MPNFFFQFTTPAHATFTIGLLGIVLDKHKKSGTGLYPNTVVPYAIEKLAYTNIHHSFIESFNR